MTSIVLKATIELLDQTNREDWKRLAEQLDVTVNWIAGVANGTIKEPGINKIERLYTALCGKSVEL